MKERRKALDIKKQILKVLKDYGEMSLRELDIKVNTNYRTIRDQVEELEFFGLVEIIQHDNNPKTGRPYTTVRLVHK
jgi:predicted ArsR family transcriptional regulator